MKKGLTEIVMVVDKSGSMHSIQNDTIGGFNTFLKQQKEVEGEANITLVLFDTTHNVVYQNIPIQSAAELNESTYVPGGGTALYDAFGEAMKLTKKRIKELSEDEKPEKVIFAVLTDGEENSSRLVNKEGIRKYTKDKIFEKVNRYQEKDGWVFIYLGANQDAMAVGSSMGFTANNTVSYMADERGISASMNSMSSYTTNFRKSKLDSKLYSESADLNSLYEESLEEIDKEKEKIEK